VKRKPPAKIRREIFVLTPEEKRTVCFVLIAFALGLATKHYRTAHPPPPLKTEVKASAPGAPPSTPKRGESKPPRKPSDFRKGRAS
jgi:hypothetical protein